MSIHTMWKARHYGGDGKLLWASGIPGAAGDAGNPLAHEGIYRGSDMEFEVVRNQFISDLTVKDISIGTEQMETEEGGTRNISNIAINMAKE